MVWALAIALPVAWALKHTRQLRYDPSFVQTLIVLPIVVSGVVLVVKNSLALAFARSMAFSLVVLTLWRYDVGAIYAGGRGAQFTIGDTRLLSPSADDARQRRRWQRLREFLHSLALSLQPRLLP